MRKIVTLGVFALVVVLAPMAGSTAGPSTSQSSAAPAPHVTPKAKPRPRPKARASHYLHQADAQNALQCGNGDCDIAAAIGNQTFVWSDFDRTSVHEVWQQIRYGPANCGRVVFHIYFPNSSNTIYDAKWSQTGCA